MTRPLYRDSDFARQLAHTFGQGKGHDAPWRSSFWRDRARVIHCPAFRRLQGKTQLFAGLESDFFRNRLTHSLEVAQIAKTITASINARELADTGDAIDADLVEFAALAHDLGHAPFGHSGEKKLDELMRDHGGFEGNAQTLRILTKLEKKLDDPQRQLDGERGIWFRDGEEISAGLNLCSRSLAAILKYEREIPRRRPAEDDVFKGYYSSESSVVERLRRDVLDTEEEGRLNVVECQIMDLADDIAYSTYDLEDAFKANLLTPLDLLFPDDEVVEQVAGRVGKELGDKTYAADVREVLTELFETFGKPTSEPPAADWQEWYRRELGRSYSAARLTARRGFQRTAFTSALVNLFIHAVELDYETQVPALSTVRMKADERRQVAVLKNLAYVLLITSHRLKLVEYRGRGILETIFEALDSDHGHNLLPEDYARRYEQAPDESVGKRVLCDFIAGMTDRYAVEFYARLRSESFRSIFRVM